MFKMNIILSYPRSGNHLTRFFIEILSEKPTFGCHDSPQDIEIHKNIFQKKIPFNISKNYKKEDCFHKYHFPSFKESPTKLILIVRNPTEAIVRHTEFKFNKSNFIEYFSSIDYYQNFTGNKKLFFYEDILENKNNFIEELYLFLELDNEEKKRYVLDNIEDLFYQSANPVKNRAWGGNNSKGKIEFYYPKLTGVRKKLFDNLLSDSIEKYDFIKKRYNL